MGNVEQIGNKCILNGDFNTIQNQSMGGENIDRIEGWRVQNSRIINRWINEGRVMDPFRTLYPLQQEVSYLPFRGDTRTQDGVKYGQTKLYFFLISPELLVRINTVRYKARLGADFDDKEVTSVMGGRERKLKITIFDSTLNDLASNNVGFLAIYESILAHSRVEDVQLKKVAQLDLFIWEDELLKMVTRKHGMDAITEDKINTNRQNIGITMRL